MIVSQYVIRLYYLIHFRFAAKYLITVKVFSHMIHLHFVCWVYPSTVFRYFPSFAFDLGEHFLSFSVRFDV